MSKYKLNYIPVNLISAVQTNVQYIGLQVQHYSVTYFHTVTDDNNSL